MTFRFSKRSIERMEGINPALREITEYALELSPIDFGIPQYGGLRTAEEQRELYDDGKSQLDGYIKKSYHQSGNALDFYAFVDGKASWDKHYLSVVAAAHLQAAAALGCKLQWGGLWKSFKDYPHVQLV